MSNTFNKIAFGSVAVFATAAAAFTPAQQANAAALKGSFDFDAQDTNPATTAILKTSEVDFQPNDAHIDLKDQEGSFVGIENALISDIPVLPGVGDPLVDEFFVFTDNEGGADDAKFSITEVFDYVFVDVFGSTIIGLKTEGFFTSSTGDISEGFATFSFDFEGTVAEAQTAMANGGLETSFSGLSVATVPEPATMAGLSLVAVGMAVAGRRKKA